MRKNFVRMDGRHKLAVVGSLIAWGTSMYFSFLGFSTEASKAHWLGWVLAFLVTVVELVFNSRTTRLSMTLIGIGLICYAYGVWSNVVGFWDYQNPSQVFPWFEGSALLSWFVGAILEILPEPLFMWSIGADMEGDLLGNLIGLFGGDLDYAKPSNEPSNSHHNKKVKYHPSNKPYKTNPKSKLMSPIFNDDYVRRITGKK